METEKIYGYWKIQDNGRRAGIIRQDAVADAITERLTRYFFPKGINRGQVQRLSFFPWMPTISPPLSEMPIKEGLISPRDKVSFYCPPDKGLLFRAGIGEYKKIAFHESEFEEKSWLIWKIFSDYPELTNHGSIKLPGNLDYFCFSRALRNNSELQGELERVGGNIR